MAMQPMPSPREVKGQCSYANAATMEALQCSMAMLDCHQHPVGLPNDASCGYLWRPREGTGYAAILLPPHTGAALLVFLETAGVM